MSNVAEEEDEETSPYSLTEDILRERRSVPNYGRISTQLFASALASLSAITFGTAMGWSSPVTYHIQQSQKKPDSRHYAWLVGMVPLGCCFGVVSWGYIMKQVGPKRALQIQAPFYILTWFLMLIETMKIQLAGRFFLGFLGMCHQVCGETLLQHTLHRDIKKYVSVIFYSARLLGVAIAQCLGYLLTPFKLTLICCSIPILHFIMIIFAPESPVFLYEKSQREAQKSLAWYRGKDNIYLEMANIRKDWEALRVDPEAYRYMLFSKVVVKAILIVLALTFFQVSSGYFIFLFYSIHVWNNDNTFTADATDACIIAAYFFISRMTWGLIHTKVNLAVRKTLITSCVMSALQLALLSVFLGLDYHKIRWSEQTIWIILINVFVMIFFYDMGLNHYPKLLIYRYLPFQVYKRAYSIMLIFFWIFIFFNVYIFAKVHYYLESYKIFAVISGILFIGAICCYFMVIEPLDKSLVQIQIEIGGNPVGNRGGHHRSAIIPEAR